MTDALHVSRTVCFDAYNIQTYMYRHMHILYCIFMSSTTHLPNESGIVMLILKLSLIYIVKLLSFSLFCVMLCLISVQFIECTYHLSRVMRKLDFCLGEKRAQNQLRSNCKADQRLRFRYTDSTIPLLPKFEISSVLSIFCRCTGWFLSDLVGNPDCLFCHARAHFVFCLLKWIVLQIPYIYGKKKINSYISNSAYYLYSSKNSKGHYIIFHISQC